MHTGFYDRVKETTVTTGTGNIALALAAPTGYRTFSSVVDIGGRVYYCVSSSGGSEWEIGYGTLSASSTLERTQVLASSNSNNLVSFSAGTKDVFCTFPAYFANDLIKRGAIEAARSGIVIP